MNTPVSFELAKTLKEKGFDEPCLNFYTNPRCKMFGIDEHNRYYPIKNKAKKLWTSGNAVTLDSKHVYYAPIIAEIVMRLYEKHGIWITTHPNHSFKYWSVNLITNKNAEDNLYPATIYNSPTEAYEEAIEYCLTKLI
jgi:hypothetical protein